MRKVVLNVLLLFVVVVVNAEMIYWDGEAGDGQWASVANWVGDVLPGLEDDVVLDNSIVPDAYQVELPPGNVEVNVNSLRISPDPGKVIILWLPLSNIAAPAFRALGPGDAVLLERGAVFRNSSGASSGTPVAVSGSGFFRINNGGRYIHNTARGHTDMLVNRLSAEPGTEEGIFEFDVPGSASYTISASNRIYGTLVFSAMASGGQKTYAASGSSPFVMQGDLVIGSHATLSYGINTDELRIEGDCIISPEATFNISNGSDDATIMLKGNLINHGTITESGTSLQSNIRFVGVERQEVESAGVMNGRIRLIINNAAGVQLRTSLTIPHDLELILGKILTNNSQLLTMVDNAICVGGSSSSFIEGPMRKIGDDDFEFPVGIGEIYAPIGIIGAGELTDIYTAEYRRANPQSTSGLGGTWQQPIHHISSVEYWLLERAAGSSSKEIRLTVTPLSFVRDLNTLLVASFVEGHWENAGGTAFVPGAPSLPYVTGSFTSLPGVSNFTAFTIATTDDELINPLPMHRLEIMAGRLVGNSVEVDWEMEDCCEEESFIQLEKASSGGRFSLLTEYHLKQKQMKSTFIDTHPGTGLVQYRLKQLFPDGHVEFSKTVTIRPLAEDCTLTLVEGLARNSVRVVVTGGRAEYMELLIANSAGMVVLRTMVYPGRNQLMTDIDLRALPAGVYYVWGRSIWGRTQVSRFMKMH